MANVRSRCSAFATTAALVLLVTVAVRLPAGTRASALRPSNDDGDHTAQVTRHRRDVAVPARLDVAAAAASAAATANDPSAVVREKRTLLKLKPLVVLPAKLALGTGAKLVAGAKLGAKAVGLGAKALGAGVVGLKAVSKVAKVTVKAATALGVKAVLLNFLFQKINQMIDFKTRLLSNLDQRNKEQNAQFLSPVLPKPSGSIGNKDEFIPPPPPASFITVPADSTGYNTAGGPTGFVPGSNLIASPPPQQQQQQQPPQQPQQAYGPPDFVANLEPAYGPPNGYQQHPSGGGQQGYEAAFAATNDDGSPSSETSF